MCLRVSGESRGVALEYICTYLPSVFCVVEIYEGRSSVSSGSCG